jgi:hypothetical protein
MDRQAEVEPTMGGFGHSSVNMTTGTGRMGGAIDAAAGPGF